MLVEHAAQIATSAAASMKCYAMHSLVDTLLCVLQAVDLVLSCNLTMNPQQLTMLVQLEYGNHFKAQDLAEMLAKLPACGTPAPGPLLKAIAQLAQRFTQLQHDQLGFLPYQFGSQPACTCSCVSTSKLYINGSKREQTWHFLWSDQGQHFHMLQLTSGIL